MKLKLATITFVLLLTATFANAQPKKPTVLSVKSVANQTTTVDGTLNSGVKLTDYSWAWSSANACFVEPQKSKYTGNHVFYVTDLPPRSILTVTVRPKKSGVNMSLYGYQIGAGKTILPEDLQSCVTCEADHKWDYPKRGKTQGDERTISFNATTNSYSVVIGVTGANGLTEGDFTLEFALKQ